MEKYTNYTFEKLVKNLNYFDLINKLKEFFNRHNNRFSEIDNSIENVTESVTNLSQATQSAIPYKEYYFRGEGQGVQPTVVFVNTFDNPVVFSSGSSGTSRIQSIGAFPNLSKVIIDTGSTVGTPNLAFNPTQNEIFLTTGTNSFINIKVYD
jgi:hypothetical protein